MHCSRTSRWRWLHYGLRLLNKPLFRKDGQPNGWLSFCSLHRILFFRILIIRLPPLRCCCAIAVLPSRPLSALFRPAWLIVADFDTFVHRELCRFPLLNYSVFVVVAGRLRVLFSNSCLISLLANCKRLHSISPSAVNFDLVLRSISFIVKLKIHRGRTPVPGSSRFPFWCLRCRCWPLDVWTAIAALLASTYALHLGAMPFEEIDSDWTCCDFECGLTSGLGYNLFVADCLFRLPFLPFFLPSAHFVDEEHWLTAIAPFILTVQS